MFNRYQIGQGLQPEFTFTLTFYLYLLPLPFHEDFMHIINIYIIIFLIILHKSYSQCFIILLHSIQMHQSPSQAKIFHSKSIVISEVRQEKEIKSQPSLLDERWHQIIMDFIKKNSIFTVHCKQLLKHIFFQFVFKYLRSMTWGIQINRPKNFQ